MAEQVISGKLVVKRLPEGGAVFHDRDSSLTKVLLA
jgi:hypothetical protein